MTTDLHDKTGLPAITTICPDLLHAVGGWITGAPTPSWLPDGAQGWFPVQGYVLRDNDQLLLIDTGLAVHRTDIREALRVLAQGCRSRRMMITRREPDAIINLPWVVKDIGLQEVLCGGPLNPLDFFDAMDDVNADAHIKVTTGATLGRVNPGDILDVGRLRVEVLRPELKVLTTNWLFERVTGSLFTSDSFGFLSRHSPSESRIARPSADEISADRIRDYLDVKFDWLNGSESDPVIEDVTRIFEGRDIQRVCPGGGCVIEGREAVKHLLSETLAALRTMQKQPWRNALADFPWEKAERIAAR